MNMTKKQRNLTFAVLLVSSIGTSLLQTALTTALPSMMRDLSISAATAQWLTSVYSLTVGIMAVSYTHLDTVKAVKIDGTEPSAENVENES